MSAAKNIAILGATGSIGRSTLDVVARHPDRFRVVALTAWRSVDALVELSVRHGAAYACIADRSLAQALQRRLKECGSAAEVLCGTEGLVQAASLQQVDCGMAAVVGAAGPEATAAAG